MSKLSIVAVALVALVGLALGAAAPVSAQTCGPLNNGRIADTFYEGNAIFWDPVVEYTKIVLTIKGPCEDIVKEFGPQDQIVFDIREIERVTDGRYTWELHRVAPIDPEVQESLQASRGSGEEDSLWWSYFQAGKIPDGPYIDSASFSVVGGEIVDPNEGLEKSALASKGSGGGAAAAAQAGFVGGAATATESEGAGGNTLATKAVVLTNGDGVIRNSLCVGFDCPNNPTFSDSTIILTENNTRIKFDDTSSINSFPRNDWEIEANSNLNGGASYLGFNDCGQSSGGGCASDLVFAVEAGVRQNALYVESDGDVGFGTANPVVRLHTVDGDTPALRLEQDGSTGFAPQTWDIAGNETSFFVRDATNGSTLPFRIFPGASSNSLIIDTNDDVGVGTTSPDASLDIERSSEPTLRLTDTGGEAWDLQVTGGGNLTFAAAGTATNFLLNNNGRVTINSDTAGAVTFDLANDGDLTITGDYFSATCTSPGNPCAPDYVFEPDYELMPLTELDEFVQTNKHLPNIPSADDLVTAGRLNMSQFQMQLLEKIEELTLYTLDQHKEIEVLRAKVAELESR